ncbi:hypothetical protein [Effusibacillus pohliae]|uniref:hypothetical protein n=1 Tax=Effusibacillus pohliae TaxID=232270 RepID=UPI00037AF82A|nr:hypothetical protein [Effusibacillus pohliae]
MKAPTTGGCFSAFQEVIHVVYGAAFIALLASVTALVFAWKLLQRFQQRRTSSFLWWSVSMILYSLAAFGEFYGLLFGMNVPVYKAYYFAAVSLVAVMAVGQVYFLSQKWGRVFLGLTSAGLLAFLVHIATVAVDESVLAQTGTVIGGDAMPKVIRTIYPPILSGIGGTVLLLGAAWSWWKTRRRQPLMVVAGSLVLMVVGRLAKLGYPEWLPLGELIGISVMYYGVLQTKQNEVSQSAPTTV